MFGATSAVKNIHIEKYVYSGYVITFDGRGSWSLGNDFAKNVVIFGVDNASSSHAYNPKNSFLLLGEGLNYGINGNFGSPDKKFSNNISKANTKFCCSLYYNTNNSYLFVNGKYSLSLKPTKKMLTFQLNCVLEAHLMN